MKIINYKIGKDTEKAITLIENQMLFSREWDNLFERTDKKVFKMVDQLVYYINNDDIVLKQLIVANKKYVPELILNKIR